MYLLQSLSKKLAGRFRDWYLNSGWLTSLYIPNSEFWLVRCLVGVSFQREQVDEMVKHLVEEFGAPAGWTSEYIQRFLDSSAMTNKAMGGVKSEQNAEKKTMSF